MGNTWINDLTIFGLVLVKIPFAFRTHVVEALKRNDSKTFAAVFSSSRHFFFRIRLQLLSKGKAAAWHDNLRI